MPVRVLVVDDDDLVRGLMAGTLEDAGLDVLEACNGEEACQLLNDPDSIALIVTDLHMPRMDGLALVKWARLRHPALPVLFVSGRPDLLGPVAGRHRYLAKPFSINQLEKVVDEMLDIANKH